MKGRHIVFLLALLAWAGCNSPASRIKKNPELFATFPADIQEKVRQGAVEVGYTKEMVEMALGKPNRMYTRQTAEGATEVWSYVAYAIVRDRQRVYADFRVRDASGATRTVRDGAWVDVENRQEFERLRLEFRDGKVIALETLQP